MKINNTLLIVLIVIVAVIFSIIYFRPTTYEREYSSKNSKERLIDEIDLLENSLKMEKLFSEKRYERAVEQSESKDYKHLISKARFLLAWYYLQKDDLLKSGKWLDKAWEHKGDINEDRCFEIQLRLMQLQLSNAFKHTNDLSGDIEAIEENFETMQNSISDYYYVLYYLGIASYNGIDQSTFIKDIHQIESEGYEIPLIERAHYYMQKDDFDIAGINWYNQTIPRIANNTNSSIEEEQIDTPEKETVKKDSPIDFHIVYNILNVIFTIGVLIFYIIKARKEKTLPEVERIE